LCAAHIAARGVFDQVEEVMVRKWAIAVAAAALLLAPATAKADWLFTPNIGAAFGGSTPDSQHLTYGASIGWMGQGAVGWEVDFGYTPEFFGSGGIGELVSDSNVTTLMANAVFGFPAGGQQGGGVRPYLAAGIGLLQTQLDSADDLFDVSRNDWGGNIGGGVMGFVSDHVGFRGDLRYFRGFSDITDIDEIGDLRVDFWRGTAGITFRW
jgi:hypothetical protein